MLLFGFGTNRPEVGHPKQQNLGRFPAAVMLEGVATRKLPMGGKEEEPYSKKFDTFKTGQSCTSGTSR